MKFQLNPEQEKWVAALENGEFSQGTGMLCRIKRHVENISPSDCEFCCLGVACELASQAAVIARPLSKSNVVGARKYNGHVVSMPLEVVTHFGFRGSSGEFVLAALRGELRAYHSLAMLNDARKSFKEIATFVRDHPELVFMESSLIKIPD